MNNKLNNDMATYLIDSAITHAINESIKTFQAVICSVDNLAAAMASVTDNKNIREMLTAISKISCEEWEQLAEITSNEIIANVDKIRKQAFNWLSNRYSIESNKELHPKEIEIIIQELRNTIKRTINKIEDGRLKNMAEIINFLNKKNKLLEKYH